MFSQVIDEVGCQGRQHRNTTQVRIQGASLVGALQLLAERLVALHDVENVTQHLEHGAVRSCPHSRRARVITHASHFPEKFSGAQLGNRIFIGKIDRSVDGNKGPRAFLAPLMLSSWRQQALQLAQKAVLTALRRDVGNGAGEIHISLAIDDVEGRRSKLALPANDLPGAEMTFDNGIAVELEEGAGNVLEDWKGQQNIGIDWLAGQLGPDDCAIG